MSVELPEPGLDEPKAVEYEFVQEPPEFKPRRNGRPNKLSVRLFVTLCRRIETGVSVLDACFDLGVSYKTLWVHVSKRPAYARRYKQAQEVEKARQREQDLKTLDRAAGEDWRAAGFRLERRFPNDWALRAVSRPDTNDTKPIAAEIPEERLKHYRALQLELARQDEADAAAKQLPNSGQTAQNVQSISNC
jgi:transposase